MTVNGDVPFPNLQWGITLNQVMSSLPTDKKITQFNPKQKENYSNKIMSYIIAIDNTLEEKITIVRINSQPVVDYLFINNTLYSVMEDWNDIDSSVEKNIKDNLEKKFSTPNLQQENNKLIYSFSDEKTKVLYYVLNFPNNKNNCAVYYYTKKLFRMLMMD
jgi:hypothetical protein